MTDGGGGPRRIFQSHRAPGRARHLEVTVTADGAIRISGQDVSNGVVENDEFGTYEWTWLVRPLDAPRAVQILGGQPGEDPWTVLDRWMAANPGDPGMVLSQSGLPVEFSSRLGD